MSEPRTVFLVGARDAGKRLDRFLHEKIPGLSRARIQRAIRDRVTLSWESRARPATPVRAGAEVRVGFVPLVEAPLDVAISVIARGTGWLAVDKPAGIAVHPVNTVRQNTIIRMLRRQERRETLRLCHRLDRETSGVLVVADGSEAARTIASAFEAGRVHKEYLAIVSGRVKADRGAIDLPIGDARGSRVFVRRQAGGSGQRALTEWRVDRRLEDRSVLRLFPRSGRRHQLRVHLAAIGHPILGDILYGRSDDDYLTLVRGDGDPRRREGGPTRQMLHCARLVFPTPDGGRADVTAQPPPDFVDGVIGGSRLSRGSRLES